MLKLGLRVFLDLKFHDIPVTMSSACRRAAIAGVELITVHACAGRNALLESQKAVLEGAIDPKETDITSPSFDKNMRNIEKINKVIDFATFLKDKEK